MRGPGGEAELVQAAAAGDPAAGAALWDAYGPRVFAFCHRILGDTDAAADAAQDAFLLALAERDGKSFGVAVFSAARTTSHELLGRDAGAPDERPRVASSLSGAAARLRPQQRAALALAGLEGLRYGEIAAVLGIGAVSVGALLARARLRLHDELHGTALAAAAVRSPDCEEVLALLGAAADGELGPADAGWADPHVTHCATCPRTRRALEEAAATYAAWSPAVAPRWLRAATLAELGAEVPAVAAPAAAAATSPRLGLSTAVLGAALLGVAFAALALSTAATLRQGDPATHGNGLADATRSLQVAGAPTRAAARPPARRRAVRHVRRARRAHHQPQHVVFVPVRAVTPAHRPTVAGPSSAARPRARRRPPSAGRRRRRPRLPRRRCPSPRRPPVRTPRPTSSPATARPRPP